MRLCYYLVNPEWKLIKNAAKKLNELKVIRVYFFLSSFNNYLKRANPNDKKLE